MLAKSPRNLFIFGILLPLLLILAGCTTVETTPAPEVGTYPVDTVFREFYTSLGGRETLGRQSAPYLITAINNASMSRM